MRHAVKGLKIKTKSVKQDTEKRLSKSWVTIAEFRMRGQQKRRGYPQVSAKARHKKQNPKPKYQFKSTCLYEKSPLL